MKLKLKNKSLISILSSIKGIIPARPTFPSQSMVLISPFDKGCYFYTQGFEAQVRYYSEDLSIENSAKKLIPVSRIYEISRNFPEDSDIFLNFHNNSVEVSCESGKYKLNGLSPDDFSLMDEQEKRETIELTEQDLKYLMEKTEFCIASQDPRHYLNGLLLSVKDRKISAVSTDGHRLALSSAAVSNTGKAEGILPRSIVAEIKRLSADTEDIVKMSIDSKNISISMKNIQLVAKTINGKFPNHEKLIPKEFMVEINLVRESFLSSLQRASAILASSSSLDEGINVSLSFSSKKLLVKSRNSEGEEATVEQDIEYGGKNIEIAFNARYLQDVTKALDTEKICIQIRDVSSGVRIVGSGSTTEEYVVMPLRI